MRKRMLVHAITGQFSIGVRRACGLLRLHRASWYYRHHGRDDTAIRMRIRELAQARPRFGYLRLHVMLRREGWVVNKKRVHRIYREEGLTVWLTRRRKRTSHLRVVPPAEKNTPLAVAHSMEAIAPGKTTWHNCSPVARN